MDDEQSGRFPENESIPGTEEIAGVDQLTSDTVATLRAIAATAGSMAQLLAVDALSVQDRTECAALLQHGANQLVRHVRATDPGPEVRPGEAPHPSVDPEPRSWLVGLADDSGEFSPPAQDPPAQPNAGDPEKNNRER